MKNRTLLPPSVFWISALGSLLVVLVVVLGISFFSAIIDAQVESRREFLSQQTALASRGLEIELELFETEFNSYFGLLQLQRRQPEESKKNLEFNTRRLINMFPRLVDSIWVDFGDEVFFFTMTSRNDLISRRSESGIPELSQSNQFLATEPNSPIRVLFSTNLVAFSNEYASNFYLAPGGRKFLMQNNLQRELTSPSYPSIEIAGEDLVEIYEDINKGLKGLYDITWKSSDGSEIQGILAQYPFSFSFDQRQNSLVFLIPTDSISSGIYSAYILFFFGIVVLLILTVSFFIVSLKNSLKSRKEIERNLHEISTLFEQQNLLLKELKGFVFFHDQHGNITEVSEEVSQVIGMSKSDFSSHFSGNSDHHTFQYLKSELQLAISEKREFVNLEIDWVKEHSQDPIRLKIFEKLVFNANGNFTGGMGICTDITESYRKSEEIKISENRLRNLISSIPDIIFIFDNEGNIIEQPVKGFEMPESQERKQLEASIYEFPGEEQRQEVIEAFLNARKSGKIQTINISLSHENRAAKHYEVRFFPLDEGRMMSISKDITGQKIWEKGLMDAMKAADQASQAKSQFLANMSHEIRTPMNGLLGIIDLLENTPLSPIQKQYVEIIKNSGNSLLSIIRDILDYSKIESGKIEILEEVFDPFVEVKEQIQILSGLAKKKKIQLTLSHTSTDSPDLVKADRLKINQVILNLVGNAIKFTPEGGEVRVSVQTARDESGLTHLVYQVSDSGIGIEEEFLDRLIEPFFQVDSSISRNFQGTGLGLAIANRMIELMGGKLTIQSTPGEGSVFSFEIWVSTVENPELIEHKKELSWKDIKEKRTQLPLNMLLVEDNELNLQLMRMMFEQLGFDFEIAKNGQQALEMIQKKSYDVVLMDVQMPVLNGIDATREIRKDPRNKGLFIIGLSANVFEDDEKKAKESGMDDYLTKPIRLAVLAEKLDFYYRKVIEQKT